MSSQPRRHLEEVVLRTTSDDGAAVPAPAARHAVHDAWEAVVREELVRLRRGHARDRRFSRSSSPFLAPPTPPPDGADVA